MMGTRRLAFKVQQSNWVKNPSPYHYCDLFLFNVDRAEMCEALWEKIWSVKKAGEGWWRWTMAERC